MCRVPFYSDAEIGGDVRSCRRFERQGAVAYHEGKRRPRCGSAFFTSMTDRAFCVSSSISLSAATISSAQCLTGNRAVQHHVVLLDVGHVFLKVAADELGALKPEKVLVARRPNAFAIADVFVAAFHRIVRALSSSWHVSRLLWRLIAIAFAPSVVAHQRRFTLVNRTSNVTPGSIA